jgi:hypothetical protein
MPIKNKTLKHVEKEKLNLTHLDCLLRNKKYGAKVFLSTKPEKRHLLRRNGRINNT